MFINEQKLSELVEEAVKKALTAEITLEKVRDEKTGQPLAVPEKITEQVFLPAFLAQTLKFNEGALRGVQEQTCKQSAKIDEFEHRMQVIGDILIQAENSLKCLAALSDNIKQLEYDK
jgi:hypothetical protein